MSKLSLKKADPYPGGKPVHIDTIEWFISTKDLCEVLVWLRDQSEPGKDAAPARDILSVNKGLGPLAERFDYVGFKGGSEPGVMNLSFLIRTRAGRWIVFSATWNNPQAPLEKEKFIGLVRSGLGLVR